MDIADLSRVIGKICGPFLIVASPIFVLLLGLDPLGADGRGTSLKEWFLILAIGISGFLVGVYMCRKEYGWFQKK